MDFDRYKEYRNIRERNQKLIIVAVPKEFEGVFQVLRNDIRQLLEIIAADEEEVA
jgi:hypothetical protein